MSLPQLAGQEMVRGSWADCCQIQGNQSRAGKGRKVSRSRIRYRKEQSHRWIGCLLPYIIDWSWISFTIFSQRNMIAYAESGLVHNEIIALNRGDFFAHGSIWTACGRCRDFNFSVQTLSVALVFHALVTSWHHIYPRCRRVEVNVAPSVLVRASRQIRCPLAIAL